MAGSIYNAEMESMSRSDLEDLQIERLQIVLNRAYSNVEFYRHRFDALKRVPDEIRSLHDLQELPFTTRKDLMENYPYGMFAVPIRDVVRLQFPMGVYGNPIVIGYTREDLKIWRELVARVMVGAGMDEHDVFQVAFNYGLFPGAIRFNQAAELIGAAVVPTSIASAEVQIRIMKDFRSTALATTPSFALHIARAMEERGIGSGGIFLRVGLFGAEPWPETARQRIEERLGLRAFDIYGVTELVEPGLAGECPERRGLHISEDHFLPEIVDPDTGEVLADGKEGELVITTLTTNAYPLLRYRTSDITSIQREPCPCGRTMARMARVFRRTDRMLVVRGINVFPEKIREVLERFEGVGPRFSIRVEGRDGMNDRLTLTVEVTAERFDERPGGLDPLKWEIRSALRRALGLGVELDLKPEGRNP